MCALFLAACAFITAPSIACGPPSFNFERRSARLSPTVDDQLTETVGNFRRASPGSRLRLTAWGDGTGTTVANRRLALRRANSVSAALIRRGIPRRAIDISIRSAPAGEPGGWVWAEVTGAQAGCG
ncbi:OmpA family protein [Sphingomonas sp.]|uniref:OmpA family protein n=1 Tax=Sphingomonas sp. TaxID=28214 RepID=UPI00345A2E82